MTIEKISLGRGDPILRMIGKEIPSPISILPTQLVIRGCSSISIGGVYRRLLKRCLTSILATVRSSQWNTETNQQEVSCCVGCGASELFWAIMWDEIGKAITHSSYPNEHHSSSPFHHFISLFHNYVSQYTSIVSPNGLTTVCQQLSSSYLQIPRILLTNYHQHFSSASTFSINRELLLWKEKFKYFLMERKPIEWFHPFELQGEKSDVLIWDLGDAFFDG